MNFKIIKKTRDNVDSIDFKNIEFGKQFADYMFIVKYQDGKWGDGKILPYQPISINPAAGVLHYGQSVYEGIKAYKNINNQVTIFRPTENIARMKNSALRICMPPVPSDLFLEALNQLVAINHKWIPNFDDGSMYIRPFLFASEEVLGVRPAKEYTFIIFCSPVNNYYKEALNVKITTKFGRAVEHGVGYTKVSGNYAASLYPATLAQKEGFHQLIWTDTKKHEYIEESGTMNIMFVKDNIIITPPLSTTILPGVTRKSLIQIAQDNNIKVEERKVSVAEVIEGLKNKTLTEAFGTGTAASIAFIKSIHHDGQTYSLPNEGIGKTASLLKEKLNNIKSGEDKDLYNWNYSINL